MAKLILTLNDQTVGEFPLNKEVLTIGRKPDNDIHVDNLSVSGHHAQIITILNDSFLEDLGSTNGTFVNSKQIKKHALKNNDIVTLGKHQLTYINELASSGDENDFEKTMIIRPDATGLHETQSKLSAEGQQQLSKEMSQAQSGGEGKLQVISGANSGKELPLTKALTTLGKPGVQVAAITKRPQGYFIIHVEGSTHPSVNGNDIGTQSTQLNDHDVIDVAGVKMEFFIS